MKIYIDTNVYNRPFDDQAQPRIRIETLAFQVILMLVETRVIDLVSSSVLDYETEQNPFSIRQQYINGWLQLAKVYQKVDDSAISRAEQLEQSGLDAIDALHVACAEASGSDYLLTCDDRLIKRYKGNLKMLNPANFVLMVTGENE